MAPSARTVAVPAGRGTAVLAGLIAAVLVAATLVVGVARPAAAAGPYTSNMLSAVNAARAAAGLRPYVLRSDLSSVALAWSQHMASTGVLAHRPNLATAVTNWSEVGENVGYGPDWGTVETAFMNSPGHRANILDHDFTEIGLGLVVSGDRIWVTQVFRKPLRSTTTTSTRTTTRTVAKPAPVVKPVMKPVVKPVVKPAPRPAAKPAASAPSPAATPAPSPQQQLAHRLQDAEGAVRQAPGDPVAQAVAYVRTMDIVSG